MSLRSWWSILLLLVACEVVVADPKDGSDDTDPVADTDPGKDSDGTGGTGVDGDRFHPADFAEPGVHGPPAKLQDLRCTSCHGSDLAGGRAVSCDDCHQPEWRTDCTYCHGEAVDGAGAPPRHISGKDDGAQASFVPHRAHTGASATHVAFDCDQCHAKPEDVLSEGHLFVGDTTPGTAETDFSAGLAPKTVWKAGANGSCSADYCHGDGKGENGTVQHGVKINGCGRCHADRTTPLRWLGMSGEHGKHLLEGAACADCHAATATGSNAIADATKHLDGTVEVSFSEPITFVGGRCDGDCHGEGHDQRGW